MLIRDPHHGLLTEIKDDAVYGTGVFILVFPFPPAYPCKYIHRILFIIHYRVFLVQYLLYQRKSIISLLFGIVLVIPRLYDEVCNNLRTVVFLKLARFRQIFVCYFKLPL